jgi:hypothetical protein
MIWILTTTELQQLVRQLTDESIYSFTGVTQPAQYAIIRRALFVWALDCKPYLSDQEQLFFEDFAREMDEKQIIIRTMLSIDDQTRYNEYFQELIDDKKIPHNSFIVHVRQLFNPAGAYIGTIYTAATSSPGMTYFWVCVNVEWEATVASTRVGKIAWEDALGSQYSYLVYGKTSSGWVQTLAGTHIKSVTEIA